MSNFIKDKYAVLLFVLLLFLSAFSVYILDPQIEGDSHYYVSSIEVLKTGIQPAGFVPMMIISTYLGLKLIMFFTFLTGDITIGWLVLNVIFFIATGLIFNLLTRKVFGSSRAAFLGTLFLMVNYAAVTFGLGYLMDMGGWFFYVASIYFSYKYLQSNESKWIYISAAIIGVGGLYKEYSFVAAIVVAGIVIFSNSKNWGGLFRQAILTAILALGPFIILNIYGYFKFDYTYLDWFLYNQGAYVYQNRLVEFIKSFGSIYNLGWFLFVPGFYILLKKTKEIFQTKIIDKNMVFIWFVILSCFSVLLWPVVTRVLFITMPAVVMISSLFIKKLDDKQLLYLIIPIFGLYFVSSYLMDAFLLDFINLPF